MELKERSPEQWARILTDCGVRATTAAEWAPIFAQELTADALSAGEAELDDFLGQVLHESAMLERMEEGLAYSAARLCAVWPHRFPTTLDASPYAHNPERLANHVYANRMGNGDEESGDGYTFRGRGLVQITGRDGYTAASEALGVDLVDDPDQLTVPAMALRSAVAWWEGHVPDECMGDCVRVTKRVNGGTEGIAHRKTLTEAAWRALNVE